MELLSLSEYLADYKSRGISVSVFIEWMKKNNIIVAEKRSRGAWNALVFRFFEEILE